MTKIKILNPFVEEDLKQIYANMQQRKKQAIDNDGDDIKRTSVFETKEELNVDKYFNQIGGEHGPHTPSDYNEELKTKPETTEDIVNAPNHYHHGGFDVYEWMQDKFTVEEYRGFCIGNMEKYLQRHKLKNDPAENLEKLRFNVDRLIESYRGIKYVPEHKRAEGAKDDI